VESTPEISTILLAIMGGFVPALFWLWFWLREDKPHPEPRGLIAAAFLSGMAIVPIVIPLQKYALEQFSGDSLIFMWVTIEEVMKYAAALVVVLWNKAVDEPIDAIIYMIAVALGFSAFENALFIFTPLSGGNLVETLLVSNTRFFGATLLHILASGTVGAFMAMSFYKAKTVRISMASLGLIIAIALHMLFNSFIMSTESSETILTVFMCVWMGIIALLLVFEKVKLIERQHQRTSY
jgi:RsiW-degrading membrane proteinase PrsW (M82 family)